MLSVAARVSTVPVEYINEQRGSEVDSDLPEISISDHQHHLASEMMDKQCYSRASAQSRQLIG
jgi:hypothetical protein